MTDIQNNMVLIIRMIIISDRGEGAVRGRQNPIITPSHKKRGIGI